MEEINNLGPFDVVGTWLDGNEKYLIFYPESKMSKLFAEGNGALAIESYFRNKYPQGLNESSTLNNFDYDFTWLSRAPKTLNAAEQVIGSWQDATANVRGSKITFSVYNLMGTKSLLFGKQLDQSNIRLIKETSADLWMNIIWERAVNH